MQYRRKRNELKAEAGGRGHERGQGTDSSLEILALESELTAICYRLFSGEIPNLGPFVTSSIKVLVVIWYFRSRGEPGLH